MPIHATTGGFFSSFIRFCGSFCGFLAGCRRQRPRGYPGLHPCSAGSRSGGWSSSPGGPPLQCCNCHGIPEPRPPWPWTPSPSAGGTVQFQPGCCSGLLQPPVLLLVVLGHLLGGPLLGLEQLLDALRPTGRGGGDSRAAESGLNRLDRPLGSVDPAAQAVQLFKKVLLKQIKLHFQYRLLVLLLILSICCGASRRSNTCSVILCHTALPASRCSHACWVLLCALWPCPPVSLLLKGWIRSKQKQII